MLWQRSKVIRNLEDYRGLGVTKAKVRHVSGLYIGDLEESRNKSRPRSK